MAGIAYVYIRLWNPGRGNIYGDTSNVLNYLERVYRDGKNTKVFEIFWYGTTQAAAEELGTAATSAKDGTTTPYQLTIVSADVNDTDAATGDVRKVAIIGVTVSSISAFDLGEQPRLTVEVVNMNGTTDVLSTRYYLRVIHPYACDWGSGGTDAKAAITIESPANTTLYAIAITQNESEGGTLYFADGDEVKLDIIHPSNADATAEVKNGVLVTITSQKFENSLNADVDLPNDYYIGMQEHDNSKVENAWPIAKRATNNSTMLFAETLTIAAKVCKIHAFVTVHSKLYR